MSREIQWLDWKTTDPTENMKMFCNINKQDLVPGLQEVIEKQPTPTSDPEDLISVHVIPD